MSLVFIAFCIFICAVLCFLRSKAQRIPFFFLLMIQEIGPKKQPGLKDETKSNSRIWRWFKSPKMIILEGKQRGGSGRSEMATELVHG